MVTMSNVDIDIEDSSTDNIGNKKRKLSGGEAVTPDDTETSDLQVVCDEDSKMGSEHASPPPSAQPPKEQQEAVTLQDVTEIVIDEGDTDRQQQQQLPNKDPMMGVPQVSPMPPVSIQLSQQQVSQQQIPSQMPSQIPSQMPSQMPLCSQPLPLSSPLMEMPSMQQHLQQQQHVPLPQHVQPTVQLPPYSSAAHRAATPLAQSLLSPGPDQNGNAPALSLAIIESLLTQVIVNQSMGQTPQVSQTAQAPAPAGLPPQHLMNGGFAPLTPNGLGPRKAGLVQLPDPSGGLASAGTSPVDIKGPGVAVGINCPRCRKLVGTGEDFISHLVTQHEFVEPRNPPTSKIDFGSQAGLGTTTGWRYLRSKNAGTQTLLAMIGAKDRDSTVAALGSLTAAAAGTPDPSLNSATTPTGQPPALSPSGGGKPLGAGESGPTTPKPPKQEESQNLYESARATAAGLLSFVFGNPDINNQFKTFTVNPTVPPGIISPKKQYPIGFQRASGAPGPAKVSPFTQPGPPNLSVMQQQNQKLAQLQSFRAQQHQQFMKQQQQTQQQQQQQHQAQQAQQAQQQQQQQQQQQLQAAAAAKHRMASATLGMPVPHSSVPAPIHSLPIHPTPIQVSVLQQKKVMPMGPGSFTTAPMHGMNPMKEPNTGPVDKDSDNPIKDCVPKVRTSLVNGDIQLMWTLVGDETKCTGYELYAYMGPVPPPVTCGWTEVGSVKALPMPMAVTLSQFSKGCSYHFTVRAVAQNGSKGPFSDTCSIRL